MMKNKQKLYFSDYYKTITHVQKHKMLNLSFKTSFIHILAKKKDRVISDKEDVIQALVILLLSKGHFE